MSALARAAHPCTLAASPFCHPQWDLGAGLSVAAMVIPQGMSYANLAGLPSVYGLYGAFVPCLVYSVLGSSRQLVRRKQACMCALPLLLGDAAICHAVDRCIPTLRSLPPPAPLGLAGSGPGGSDFHPSGQRPQRLHRLKRGP